MGDKSRVRHYLYAYVRIASRQEYGRVDSRTTIDLCWAIDNDHAAGIAHRKLEEQYPADDGWRHDVGWIVVPDDAILRAAKEIA